MAIAFDDGPWMSGVGGFGALDTRFAKVGTEWKTPDIWLRTTFDGPASLPSNPHLRIFHDEDAEVYVNGRLVAELPGANSGYAFVPLRPSGTTPVLRPGRNIIAVHVETHVARQRPRTLAPRFSV